MKITIGKNYIFCGDNLEWLKQIPDNSIDLCYIDPPFFSNRNYEVIWGNGYELRSFGDRFAGGISHYIDWMKPRIELVHQKLKKDGSLFLHCDWHAVHRLRCMLDDIFDEKNFRNEIIWHYEFRLMDSERQLNRKHDNILFYAKSDETKINMPKTPWTREEIIACRKQKIHTDSNGKEWVWMPGGKGNSKNKKKYLSEIIEEGKASSDVWPMLPLTSSSKERLGYPTQKPEALVRKVIEMASSPGATVLDCFVGGGTTAKVAADLKRNFIVGDVSPVATRITAERISFDCPGTKFELKNLPRTTDGFKKVGGHKFAEMVCELMGWELNPRKSGDGGVDGWDAEGYPLQIKNQAKPTSRDDVQKFVGALASEKKKRGVFVAWEFSKPAMEYIANVKQSEKIEIIPKKCDEIFGGLLIPEKKQQEIEKLYSDKRPKAWKANSKQIDAVLDEAIEAKGRARKGRRKEARG